ncbi:unnamed protein product, partial [Tetraodon nigroviridis]
PADVISTVEFNQTGDLLATGDKGGRVVIFQRETESKGEPEELGETVDSGEYNVYSTFQSHEPDFDYLKSLEIEEKINKIRWLPQQNAAHFLLSTNDKTIKLWKVSERDKRPEGYNLKDEEGRLKDMTTITSLQGSILDFFLDIVDIKPANMEDLTEVITAAEFHPHHCHLFVYSSSKGIASPVRHESLRALRQTHQIGRYLLTRDYLTAKVWDLNMDKGPVETYQVHEYLRSKLCSLYENDCIFDKFECVWNSSDRQVENRRLTCLGSTMLICTFTVVLFPMFPFICHSQSDTPLYLSVLSVIMTGAYNSFFRMFDRETGRGVTLEAWRESSKPRAVLRTRRVYTGGKRRRGDVGVDSLDFTKKILHMAWHPSENIIAIAATNNLYIFQDRVNPE